MCCGLKEWRWRTLVLWTGWRLATGQRLQSHSFTASAADCHLFVERIDGGFDEPGNVRIAEQGAIFSRRNHNVCCRVIGWMQGRGPHVGALKVEHPSAGLDELRSVAEIKENVLLRLCGLPTLPRHSAVELVDHLEHSGLLNLHETDSDLPAGTGSKSHC